MVLSTQVAQKDRQSASLYPSPYTLILGVLNFAFSVIVLGILADFVYELRGDGMPVPWSFIITLSVSTIAVWEQIIAFLRQRSFAFSARRNLFTHVITSTLWVLAFALLTYQMNMEIFFHECSTNLWRADLGVMVCRMYKSMYLFSILSLATSIANMVLDIVVLKQDRTAGTYRALDEKNTIASKEETSYHGASIAIPARETDQSSLLRAKEHEEGA